MKCFRCARSAVIYQQYSGRHLCPHHLSADIETRAKRVIRQNHWLSRGDRIGVASGLSHSNALLLFLMRLTAQRNDISLVILTLPMIPPDGTARISAFSELARSEGVTRLALPDCADDTAGKVMSSILRGDAESLLSRHGTGSQLPVMHPLREIPAVELGIYADQYQDPQKEKIPESMADCQGNPFDLGIRTFLNEYSKNHPSAPHALRRYRDLLRTI